MARRPAVAPRRGLDPLRVGKAAQQAFQGRLRALGDVRRRARSAPRGRDDPEPPQADRPARRLGRAVEPLLNSKRPDHAPMVAEPEPEPLQTTLSPLSPPRPP